MAVRVLIVDDHAPFRALARMLLVLDGFAVAETLAADPAAPAVVLVSSRSRSDYGFRPKEDVARGFIDKAELSGTALRLVLGDAPPGS